MARSLTTRVVGGEAEFAEIIAWYEDLLRHTPAPKGLAWEPIRIGPTWQRTESGWLLPEYTVGWRVLAWCGIWLRDKHGQPWQFTPEQARFILWYFAIDPETTDFLYHSAVLQRLKGWGKDPVAACLCAVAMFGPVTFDRWGKDKQPVARDEPAAWIQIVAVSQVQTQNTMKLFPSLFSPEARRRYGIHVGKLNVWGLSDTRQIEAITASPAAVEGGRPTQIVANETQNWIKGNGGHEMAGAIEGNAAKSEIGSPARILHICNAFRPGRDSVAERVRESWERTQGENPETLDYGLMYDSLEAPPQAPLTVDAAPAVIQSISGDARWLDTRPKGRIMKSILDPQNAASESRRKWYNQIVAAEDARFDPNMVKAAATIEALQIDDEIVIFGDGSKSGDATGLVGCRLPDGLCQTLHVQQPKKGEIVDRGKVDDAVEDAFQNYKVVAFWFDPSHARADDAEGDERFFHPLCDEWMARYGRQLRSHFAVKTGESRHAVIWDMASPARQALFVPAVEQLDADLEGRGTPFQFHQIGPSSWMQRHLINAREHPGRYGNSLRKEHRSSQRKIDLAVCVAGARMLRRSVLLSRTAKKKKGTPGKGRVVVLR